MSPVLLPVRAPDHPPLSDIPHDIRLRLSDRLSLRLGLWLLQRSSLRLARSTDRAAHATASRLDQAERRRDAEALVRCLLGPRA